MAKKGFIDDDALPLDSEPDKLIEPGTIIELAPGEYMIAESPKTTPDDLAAAMLAFSMQLEATSAALVTLAELIKDLPDNESHT